MMEPLASARMMPLEGDAEDSGRALTTVCGALLTLIISNNSINPCSNKTINHNQKKFEPRTDYQQPINFTYRMDYWMNAIEQDLTPEFQIQGNDPRGT
jgi:hypothetical protein